MLTIFKAGKIEGKKKLKKSEYFLIGRDQTPGLLTAFGKMLMAKAQRVSTEEEEELLQEKNKLGLKY